MYFSGTEKRGRETNILKRGETGSRGGCLKKGGAGTPLQTMPIPHMQNGLRVLKTMFSLVFTEMT